MNLTEAYLNIYTKPEFDQELYENLLSICLSEEIFGTVEECQYFAEQLILEDLSIEFLGDIVEAYDLDISEYLEETAGINIFERTRAIINALSRSGRAKAGLELGTALGRRSIEGVLNRVRGAAASTTIRSARRARPVVEPQGPGRYLDMLNTRRSQSGGRSPNSMTADAQRFQQLNRSASARAGKGAEDAAAAAQAQQQARAFAPGIGDALKSAQQFSANKATATRTSARNSARLAAGFGKPGPLEVGIRYGAAPAAAGGLAAAGLNATMSPKSSEKKPIKTGVYNTKDPDGRIRDRKIVGPKIVGPKIVGTGSVAGDFDAAFKKAKTSGKDKFDFKGKKYTTESVDDFDIVIEHLITEGYVATNEDALVMMSALDEGVIGKIAAGAIKNTIKSGSPKLTKITLPPKMDPVFKAVKDSLKRKFGAGGLVGTPEYKYAAAAKKAELAKNPPSKPKSKDPFPGDVYSRSDFGIRGYRSGD